MQDVMVSIIVFSFSLGILAEVNYRYNGFLDKFIHQNILWAVYFLGVLSVVFPLNILNSFVAGIMLSFVYIIVDCLLSGDNDNHNNRPKYS